MTTGRTASTAASRPESLELSKSLPTNYRTNSSTCIGSFSDDGNSNGSSCTNEVDIDDAIEMIGMGRFQAEVLLAAGLCFAADSMEILLLSFLAVVLHAEWGLSEREMDTVVSIVFAGAMMGTLVLGPLGDRIGRKPVFVITAAVIAIFGVATALVTTMRWFFIVRFIVGFGVGGLTIPFDTLAEFVPTSHRGTNLLCIEFFWTAGTLLVPVLARWTIGSSSDDSNGDNGWRWFVILCAVPCVLSMILGFYLVPESPRWLLTRGRNNKALRILRRAAFKNGKDGYELFPEGTVVTHTEDDASDDTFTALFSPKWRTTTLQLWGTWFGLAFLYFGAILLVSIVFTSHPLTDDDGGEDKDASPSEYDFDYGAILISGSSEVFGLCLVLLTVDRWGRVASQSATYLLGGVTCLVLGCLNESDSANRTLLIVFAFLARLFMMGASCTTWVATSEILSTDIRATGHSAANAMARLGAFFAPYIITPGTSSSTIGGVMFGIGLATAYISSKLPETAGRALGDVLVDADRDGDGNDSSGVRNVVDGVASGRDGRIDVVAPVTLGASQTPYTSLA